MVQIQRWPHGEGLLQPRNPSRSDRRIPQAFPASDLSRDVRWKSPWQNVHDALETRQKALGAGEQWAAPYGV